MIVKLNLWIRLKAAGHQHHNELGIITAETLKKKKRRSKPQLTTSFMHI